MSSIKYKTQHNILIHGLNELREQLKPGDIFFYFSVGESRSSLTPICGPNEVIEIDLSKKTMVYKDSKNERKDDWDLKWSNCVVGSTNKEEVEEMHGRYTMDDGWDDDDED